MLQAHETAHQWWGNRVTAATYRDYWLMEALANYSALLYLEREGRRAMESMLDSYRNALLVKNEAGQTVESAGADRAGPAAGDLAGAARLAHHHLWQRHVDHPHAAPADGR